MRVRHTRAHAHAHRLPAWPDPLPRTLDATIAMVPVAAERTGPSGEYAFTEAQLESSTHAAKLRDINARRGHVNFEILGATPRATGAFDFSRTLKNGSWQREGGVFLRTLCASKRRCPRRPPTTGQRRQSPRRAPTRPILHRAATVVSSTRRRRPPGSGRCTGGLAYRTTSSMGKASMPSRTSASASATTTNTGPEMLAPSSLPTPAPGRRTDCSNTVNGQYDVSSFWREKYRFTRNGVGPRCNPYEVRRRTGRAATTTVKYSTTRRMASASTRRIAYQLRLAGRVGSTRQLRTIITTQSTSGAPA